uniref:Uncharacterized protein n=1 Tax=Lotus japonicus TaxID=34305 RepID=I3SUT7_LOTJA|nr:unknown [Lotus japonicus]
MQIVIPFAMTGCGTTRFVVIKETAMQIYCFSIWWLNLVSLGDIPFSHLSSSTDTVTSPFSPSSTLMLGDCTVSLLALRSSL